MNGIDNKPYIDCDNFLNISQLIDLELEICAGIALSKIQSGIYGPGIVNDSRYGNFLKFSEEINSDTTLKEKYKWDLMNQNQKNIFLKLYKNLYSPNNSVYLKSAPNYASLKQYLDKANHEVYTWDENIKNFPNLKIWLDSLIGTVFKNFGRTMFFLHEHDCELLIHRDGSQYRPHKNEFLWINPIGKKNFFIYDEHNDKKIYVNSKVAFFNDLDMHGGDPNPSMTWTLRIDGVFTDDFKKLLGIQDLSFY
jgi:hypothetical protein